MSRPPCGSFWYTSCSWWTSVSVSNVCLCVHLCVISICVYSNCVHTSVGSVCGDGLLHLCDQTVSQDLYINNNILFYTFPASGLLIKKYMSLSSGEKGRLGKLHTGCFVKSYKGESTFFCLFRFQGNPHFKFKFLILTQQPLFSVSRWKFLTFCKEWMTLFSVQKKIVWWVSHS